MSFCRLAIRSASFSYRLRADAVGILQRGLIVHVVRDAVKARAVAGRDALAGGRILHILDAVAAEQQVPVRLGIRIVLADQPLVDRRSLVKLAVAPQMRAAVEQAQPLAVVRLRQRHRAAAVFARVPKVLSAEISISPPHILHLIIAIFLVLLSLSVGEFDVSPAGHIVLTQHLVTHRHNRAVRLQTDGVIVSCYNGDNVSPAGHIALTPLIVTHGHDHFVCFQADRVPVSGADGNNIRPVRDIALVILIAANGNHSSV